MFEQQLEQSGLTKNQALVYEALLKAGKVPARSLLSATPLKRGLLYKTLDELALLGIIAKKDDPGKVAVFEPAHPSKLKEIAEAKEKQAQNAQIALDGILGQLSSDYNLAAGKPSIKFYEGIDGFRQITEDSLRAKTEIYSFVDNEAVNKYIGKENQEYIKRRKRLGIKKKMIGIDTPFIREHAKVFDPEISEIRLVDIPPFPFETVMQIYDDKISYLTLKPSLMVGIIIQDEYITRMHRHFFEYIWRNAKTIS